MRRQSSTCDAALLYQNSMSVSPIRDLCIIRVMYTVKHSTGQLKSSEQPNESTDKPFGAFLVIAIN